MPLPPLNRNPSDYQTAVHVREFMQNRLHGDMLTGAQLDNLRRTGQFADSHGKNVRLSQAERTALLALQKNHALFDRLDAGRNGTHDGVIGAWDIKDAVGNGRIHSADERNPRHGKPTGVAAWTTLGNFFKQTIGNNWNDQVSRQEISTMVQRGTFTHNGKRFDVPHDVMDAAALLNNGNTWRKIQVNNSNTLSAQELARLPKALNEI